MSREIRRVPLGWDHPRKTCAHSPWRGGCDYAKAHGGKCFQPLYDETLSKAMEDFRANPEDWDNDPPDPEYYRPDFGDSATAYQVYETVSEGTPISPVFATEDELLTWLTSDGDGLGIGGRKQPLTQKQAEAFVGRGHAPSMIYTPSTGVVSGLELPNE